MKITLTTGGSRGDVQPYIALSVGLQNLGHDVTLSAPKVFEGLAGNRGLHFKPLSLDPDELLHGQLKGGRASSLAFALRSGRLLTPYAQTLLEETWAACEDADAVIYTSAGYLGREVARHLGVPHAGAMYGPLLTATGDFPSSFAPVPIERLTVPPRSVSGRLYNRLSYPLSQQLLWQFLRGPVDRSLRRAGMRSLGVLGPFKDLESSTELLVHGWSEAVLPAPEGWGPSRPVTGYWFLEAPEGWHPPPALRRFLEKGPPAVSIGFGSMDLRGARGLWDLVLHAVRSAGVRGVLITGRSARARATGTKDIIQIAEVPHERLFPACSAAIHHGGAGTTAAAARAGIPSVILPFFADQTFWGARIAALGAGPPAQRRRSLTSGRLATAIRLATHDPTIRRTARLLGETIRRENGVDKAAGMLDRYFRAQ